MNNTELLYSICFEIDGKKLYSISNQININETYRLTLFPFISNKKNENKIINEFNKLNNLNFIVDVDSYDNFYGNHAVIKFINNDNIFCLHKNVVNIFSKYSEIDIFGKNKDFTNDQNINIEKYGYPFVLSNFIPHISLGDTKITNQQISGNIELDKISILKLVRDKWFKIK